MWARRPRAERFLLRAVLLAAGLLLAACAPPPPAPTPTATSAAPLPSTPTSAPARQPDQLRVAYVESSAVHEPLHLAKQRGLFAQQGLDVELTAPSGQARTASLIAGEIQLAALGSPEIVEASAQGVPVVALASLADYPMFSIYATPDIRTVQDLAGKVIGVGRIGADTDLAARFLLQQYGLQDQVQYVPVGGSSPAVLAALQNRAIAAGIFAPPATAQAEHSGLVEVVNGPRLGSPWTSSAISVLRPYLADHPDLVRRFLAAFQQAWTFCADPANRDAVVADIAAVSGTPADQAAASYDYVFPVWSGKPVPTVDARGLANALAQSAAASARNEKPEDLIDNSLLESLGQ